MKINWVKLLITFILLMICGISLFIYLFIQEHDYPVDLGNGYRYFGAKDNLTVIDREGMSEAERRRVYEVLDNNIRKNINDDINDVGAPRVGPNVDGYRVYSRIIIGHVSEQIYDNPQYKPRHKKGDPTTPGYFIIDTRINRICRGLSKQEWKNQLQKYGLDHEPNLFRPSKSDVRLGHNKPQPLSN